MKTHLSILILLLANTFNPIKAADPEKLTNVAQLKASVTNIDFIRKHGILIRLRTNDAALTALRKNGNNETADKLEEKQTTLNNRIIAAFKEQFNFAPVYFFYSRDMENIRKGDYSKLYTLDNQPANYSGSGNFFMVDPYYAVTKSFGSSSTGFTLMDSSSMVMISPMPKPIIKRFGLVYKTYPQLVFDWNFYFKQMDYIASKAKHGELKFATEDRKFSNSENRQIARLERLLQKEFKRSYNWSGRPKLGNKDQ